MKPTVEYLQKQYKHYNELIFRNSLPMLPIVLTNQRNPLGNTEFHQLPSGEKVAVCIRITSRYDMPEAFHLSTLVHEMVHVYISVRHLHDDDTHGKIFQKIIKAINDKYDMHLDIALEDNSMLVMQEPRRRRYFCLLSQTDGSKGIVVAAKNKVPSFWRVPETLPTVEEYHWYISTNPYFSQFHTQSAWRVAVLTKPIPEEIMADTVEMDSLDFNLK